MLNCEGDLIHPNDRHPSIKAPPIESYLSFPSIHAVNAAIDEVIANRIDNCELISQPQLIKDYRSLPNHKENNFTNELSTNTLLRKKLVVHLGR